MKKVLVFLVIGVLFAVTVMILNAILSFIPWDTRRYFGYVLIPVGVLWFLRSFFKWRRTQLVYQSAYQSALDCLEVAVLKHEDKQRAIVGGNVPMAALFSLSLPFLHLPLMPNRRTSRSAPSSAAVSGALGPLASFPCVASSRGGYASPASSLPGQ
jgi:hypothetical protein